jgi:hypothetical protein
VTGPSHRWRRGLVASRCNQAAELLRRCSSRADRSIAHHRRPQSPITASVDSSRSLRPIRAQGPEQVSRRRRDPAPVSKGRGPDPGPLSGMRGPLSPEPCPAGGSRAGAFKVQAPAHPRSRRRGRPPHCLSGALAVPGNRAQSSGLSCLLAFIRHPRPQRGHRYRAGRSPINGTSSQSGQSRGMARSVAPGYEPLARKCSDDERSGKQRADHQSCEFGLCPTEPTQRRRFHFRILVLNGRVSDDDAYPCHWGFSLFLPGASPGTTTCRLRPGPGLGCTRFRFRRCIP